MPASATVRVPACGPLGAWANAINLSDRWQVNRLGPSRHTLPRHIMAPETATLFGAPALDWSEADLAAIGGAIRDCGAEAQRERRNADRTALNRAGSVLSGLLPQYRQARDRARAEAERAVVALGQLPPSLPALRFEAALARIAEGPAALQQATAATNALPPAAAQPARALLGALRDLPEAELRDSVQPAAEARAATMRTAVRDALLADVAGFPASAQGLAGLRQASTALHGDLRRLFPAADIQALERAVATRRDAAETEVVDAQLRRLAAIPPALEAFGAIDAAMPVDLLALLQPAAAARLREAGTARRAAILPAVEASFRAQLARLPETDATLRLLDRDAVQELAALPPSAAAEAERLRAVLAARRAAVLAAVNRAEAGPLRGRRYESDGGQRLDFVDRSRVNLTLDDGRTIQGSFAEDGAERVTITIDQQARVFRREGARLIDGPTSWQRVPPR